MTSQATTPRHGNSDRERMRCVARIARLHADEGFLGDLHQVAAEAAPARSEESAWPSAMQEMADKITRQTRGWGPGGLGPTEDQVRDRDRRVIADALPPSIGVSMDDPVPFPC